MNATQIANYIASLERKLADLENGYFSRRAAGLDFTAYENSIQDVRADISWAKGELAKATA